MFLGAVFLFLIEVCIRRSFKFYLEILGGVKEIDVTTFDKCFLSLVTYVSLIRGPYVFYVNSNELNQSKNSKKLKIF